MNARAYILLNITDGKSEQVAFALRDMPGVTSVDRLEGHPNVIVMMEASDRITLAEYLMPALTSIDDITVDLTLLPAL